MNIDYQFKKALFFLLFMSLVIFCSSGIGLTTESKENSMSKKYIKFQTIGDVPPAKLEQLAQKKIYFGHHSVGANIIKGINDLMIEYPDIDLNIVHTANESDFTAGIFAHSQVGENLNPDSKIDDFVRYIDKGIGNRADIAGFKFCFVDIQLEADVDKLLSDYIQSIEEIRQKYPELMLIHFTAPLKSQKMTWKQSVKKMLHIDDPWIYGPNIKRNEYNERLIEKYGDTEPIFDIADIESTYPDGTRCTFKVEDKTYYSLVPEYTSDGGHLNEIGRKTVAEKFILFLASID